ncbi:Hypothetical predicted protein [Cloeon dipterum]|uniref:G-protein coupled receptors family 3 profile domain-containing protein n=1 Tax=Cloeon dipterum TaxID=197152 RepID=A0A8S1DSH4_9INSE|nr:Hypothetical predicted protein [Cloeon dipterum]
MLKASLHLILVLACCCSAAAADDEDPSVTTTSTTITVLALNHRPSPFLTSEINALALQAGDEQDATQQERLTSLPQSSKALPPSTEKKHRPGTVTNLGVINLDEEVVKQLAQRGPSNHKSVEATTTEVTLVTVNPRPTKRISTAGGKRATSQPFGSGILRNEPWVLPLLVLSAIVLFTMTTFEVFVLCRAKSAAPSRRHLFLGQMLLLGVFMCVLLAALQALTPSFVTCAMTRLGVGLAYAIVFATLLVKSVFLISLNGGVYLPAPYQALLLLFAVLIQVAVGSQWLLNAPPRVFSPDEVPITKPTLATPRGNSVGSRISTHQVITASDVTPVKGSPSPLPEPYGVPLCATAYEDSLASLIYVVFLMGFVGILAAKSRGIRENYRESTYIGLSIACCAPLWLGWALAGLALAPRHQVKNETEFYPKIRKGSKNAKKALNDLKILATIQPSCFLKLMKSTVAGCVNWFRPFGNRRGGVFANVPSTRPSTGRNGSRRQVRGGRRRGTLQLTQPVGHGGLLAFVFPLQASSSTHGSHLQERCRLLSASFDGR